MSQVSVAKLQDWLKNSLSTNLSQAEREREKIVSEIPRALESIRDFCSQLLKKGEHDMESKRDNRAQFKAAKAVGRLTSVISEMISTIDVPSSRDTATLRNLQRGTSKLASEAAQARIDWLRQIRPYYIIDMMTLGGNIDKLRRLSDELHNFLIGRGALLRSLEELDEKIESLNKIQHSKEAVSTQRHVAEQRLAEAQEQESILRERMDEILQNSKMKEYMQIDSQLKDARNQVVRSGFSRLGRPLRKLASMSQRGEYSIPIDVRENLDAYLKKPFTAFLKEDDGYPNLKRVLTELGKAVSSGKLALKAREAKKVVERTEQVVSGNSLNETHIKSRAMKRAYDEFLADPDRAKLVEQLRGVRSEGRSNHAFRKELKSELSRILESEKRLDDQISSLVKDIEAFSRKISGTNVTVQLS